MQAQTGNVKYTSTIQTIARVTREDSFLRLYRGLATPLFTVALNNSVTFGVYGLAMKYLVPRNWNTTKREASGGFIAGVARVAILTRK